MTARKLHLVVDPEFDLDHGSLQQSIAQRRNVLLATARRGDSRAAAARTLARALGRTQADWHHPSLWTWATSWLEAQGIEHLVVSTANNLDARCWPPLVELSDELHVWLLVQGRQPTRGQRRAAEERPNDCLTIDEFSHALTRLEGDTRLGVVAPTEAVEIPVLAQTPRAFPEVPMRAFPDFEKSCRERLEAPDLAVVLAAFEMARRRTALWLPHRPDIRPERAFGLVRKLIASDAGPDEAITTLRGIQVEFWRAGYLLQAPSDQFRAARGIRRFATYRHAAPAFAAYLNTAYPAAAALVLDAEFPAEALAGLQLRDVATDGRSVRSTHGRSEVSNAAARALRAHRASRRRQHATPGDPYLVWLDKGRNTPAALSPKLIKGWLGRLSAETGVDLAGAIHEHELLDSWARRHGLSLHRLRPESTRDAA